MSRKTSYNAKMQVKRLNTSGQTETGGVNSVKVSVFSAPCRVRQLNAIEMSVGGKDGVVSTHRVYCNRADIRGKDELIIDKRIYDVNTVNLGSFNNGSMEINTTVRY